MEKIEAYIKAAIIFLQDLLGLKRDVASITRNLKKMSDDLSFHADDMKAKADAYEVQITKLITAKHDAIREREKAIKSSKNIAELVQS